MKNEIDELKKENKNLKEIYSNNLENIKISMDKQLDVIRDREQFSVSQLMELEEKFNNLRLEKDRITMLLKEELDEIKSQNIVLSRFNAEATISQSPNKTQYNNSFFKV